MDCKTGGKKNTEFFELDDAFEADVHTIPPFLSSCFRVFVHLHGSRQKVNPDPCRYFSTFCETSDKMLYFSFCPTQKVGIFFWPSGA